MIQVNLALRFLLEVLGIAAIGYWGYQVTSGPLRFALAIGLPVVAVVLWSALVAPKADSRLPPHVRIMLGSLLLVLSAIALYAARQPALALVFAALIVVNTILIFVLPEP